MKIWQTIYYVFLGVIGAIAILLIVSVFPITGNFKVLTVQSGSMMPAIKTGSIVLVKPTNNYKIGDIITFGQISKTKTPTTHRIAEIEVANGQPIYTTKGDANNAPDQKQVSAKEVIGRVLLDVPFLGYAVAAAKKPWGFMLLIAVPALLVIYEEAHKIWQEIKKSKTKKLDDEKMDSGINSE
ncbi:MAG: signal peptidase I [Candidatus Portnoybacteria bacterium CG06_land_8_20_14_3_00_39_12]|uniref:Signal peptidase I n=1 Tax=Candidatus Portnoybacteria bacterium CG06_land_8_20_14_3_00_39_12 TaxID=1974809 RepID=A0A2M7AX60_9BACT|nr:MAG: signal peptidase I [Candidatus Portnoybacteria bacterium CG06_land_8_20_14_3_00_39_12]